MFLPLPQSGCPRQQSPRQFPPQYLPRFPPPQYPSPYPLQYRPPYPQQYPVPQHFPPSQNPQPFQQAQVAPKTIIGGQPPIEEGIMDWTIPKPIFSEKQIRAAFVRKVFTILAVQLIFTSCLIGLFIFNQNLKTYFREHPALFFVGAVVSLVCIIILSCVECARRSSPCNYILLLLLTIGYGLMAAIASCHYETILVLLAFGATAASCALIALIALTTSYDLTGCGCTLCLLGIAHLVFGAILMAILVPMGYANIANIIYSTLGALLCSLYLAFDLQYIMGGRQNQISPEEYVMAAAMLYTDIVTLFIHILSIIGEVSKS